MNKRIKELLLASGVNDNWNAADWYSVSPAMMEIFAESIIKECVQLCFTRALIMIDRNEKTDDKFLNGVKAMTYNMAGEFIKEHFEVKA